MPFVQPFVDWFLFHKIRVAFYTRFPHKGLSSEDSSVEFVKIRTKYTHGHAALFQLESHSQSFSHKHIGIMTREKCPFQFLQLPAIKVGPAPSPFASTFVRFTIAAWNYERTHVRTSVDFSVKKLNHLVTYYPFISGLRS